MPFMSGPGALVCGKPVTVEDDTVVATSTYSWKHRSTGKPAEVQMADVWTFRDGKVISMQQHVDTLKVQELSA